MQRVLSICTFPPITLMAGQPSFMQDLQPTHFSGFASMGPGCLTYLSSAHGRREIMTDGSSAASSSLTALSQAARSYGSTTRTRRMPTAWHLSLIHILQGYTDGSCEQGKELDTLEGTVTRTELPLAELLRQIAAAQLGADASADEVKRLAAAAAELLTQYGVCSATPAERYSEGRLDDLLQDAETVQRVCYAAAEITIPVSYTHLGKICKRS